MSEETSKAVKAYLDGDILDGIRDIRDRLKLVEKTDYIEVSKGMTGKYGWTIKHHSKDLNSEAIDALVKIDGELRKKFGGEQA
jgi:hypothetical protein